MKPRAVVEALDPLEDREAGGFSCAVVLVVDELGLEGVEEALGDGVVEAVPRPAHARDEAVAVEQGLVGGRRVLAAAIGVVDEPGLWPPPMAAWK